MLLKDKKVVIFGVANRKSIAYGIAQKCREQGARLAFSYVGEALKKRVEPLSEELGGEFIFDCNVAEDGDIQSAAETVAEKWGEVDVLVHSVAFADREDLSCRYVDTSRQGFHTAIDVSAYSLVRLCKSFEPYFSSDASVMAMTYIGSTRAVKNYNVMGVAKAALEASVRYLAVDLGEQGVRVNAISAGPIKTLASSGVSGFKEIFKTIEEKSPLHRNVSQEEVGKSAVYLASDLSSGVTGEIVHVDSGYNIVGV